MGKPLIDREIKLLITDYHLHLYKKPIISRFILGYLYKEYKLFNNSNILVSGDNMKIIDRQLYIPNIEINQNRSLHKVRESKAIPFNKIINAYNKIPRATHERVMFIALALTGCRISELDKFKLDGFIGDYFHFHVGKNQKGTRKVKLPKWYINELKEYRSDPNFKFKSLYVFGISANSFKRFFDRDIRKILSNEWSEQVYDYHNKGWSLGYKYQMRGLRKTYCTHTFYKYWKQTKDATASMELTCKELKHSNKGITVTHYIQDGSEIDVDKYTDKEIHEILTENHQKNLQEF